MAHYSLGYDFTMQGRTDEAISHLREALAADSINSAMIAESHDLLGDCLATQGKNDEAFAHYEEAVRAYPSRATFHARLAMALASRGQLDRAIVEWRETDSVGPRLPQTAHLGLANALLAEGDASGAAVECREVLKQNPDSVEAIVVLGAALVRRGQNRGSNLPTRARRGARTAQRRLPTPASAWRSARSWAVAERLSLISTRRFVFGPAVSRLLWQMAWILATIPDPAVRDGERAIELARRAIQRSKGQECRAFDALAAALAETGQFPAAIDAAEQASTIALTRGDTALADAIDERRASTARACPITAASVLAAARAAVPLDAAGMLGSAPAVRGWLLTSLALVVELADKPWSHATRGGGSLARSKTVHTSGNANFDSSSRPARCCRTARPTGFGPSAAFSCWPWASSLARRSPRVHRVRRR